MTLFQIHISIIVNSLLCFTYSISCSEKKNSETGQPDVIRRCMQFRSDYSCDDDGAKQYRSPRFPWFWEENRAAWATVILR